jgi:hypothetical protein
MQLHLLGWLVIGYAEFVTWNAFFSLPSKVTYLIERETLQKKDLQASYILIRLTNEVNFPDEV